MRTKYFWVGLGCAIAAAAAAACHGGKNDGPVGPKDGDHAAICAKKHPLFPRPKQLGGKAQGYTAPVDGGKASRFQLVREAKAAPPPRGGGTAAFITGDCPSSDCGLNGTWLGAGVPFRTLHLSRYRHNDQNLSILAFEGPVPSGGGKRKPLTLAVEGDVLRPKDAAIVEPGSVLRLGPPEWPGGPENAATYELTITKVHDLEFWTAANCPGCTPKKFPAYEFSATSLSDGCELQVCSPGLDDDSDRTNNLLGTAVIFRGDYYDDGYNVRIVPPSSYDDDVFNIACLGTTLSKLHRFRHTTAAKITASDPPAPPVDRRQALLRMITADYCGAGFAFTHDGVRLNLGFDSAMGFGNDAVPDPHMGTTPGSHFTFETAPTALRPDSLEAAWTADGATCLGTPRLIGEDAAIRDKIKAACRLVNHRLPDCPAPTGSLASQFSYPFLLGSYAVSQNP